MKKLLALVLCLLMCLSLTVGLTACGGAYPEDSAVVTDDEAKELIVGDWTGNIIVPEEMLTELQDDLGEMKDYVDLSGLTLEVNLGFNKNGKGTVTMSKEAAKKFAQKAFNLVCEGAVDYLRNKFEVSDEKWTEYLEELGMTEQELLDTVLEKIETENAAEDIAEKLEYNAFYYCLKDGKIYISETKEFDEEDAAGYKMTEDALYIEVDSIAVKFDRAE